MVLHEVRIFLERLLALASPRLVLALIFLAGIVEATPILGILIPAHTAIFLFAAQWATIGRDPIPLVLASTVGGTLGDILFYAVGRRTGLDVLRRLPGFLRLNDKRQAQLDNLFRDHGVKTIILSRSQLITRSFGPFVAGGTRMSFWRFVPAAAVGSLILSVAAVGAGYLVGLGSVTLGHAIGPGLFLIVLLIVVVLALYFFVTKHFALMAGNTLTLALLAATGLGSTTVLVWRALHSATFLNREAGPWGAALTHMPHWAVLAAAPLSWLGNIHLLVVAFLAIAGCLAAKGRWRQAYLAFGIGPGLTLLLIVLRWRIPRLPPSGIAAAFPMTGSFPNETAALAVALAALVAWLAIGPRRATGRERVWRILGFVATGLVVLAPLVRGRAWPSDILLGVTLGIGWSCLLLLGDVLVRRLLEPAAPTVGGEATLQRIRLAWTRTVAWCDGHLTNPRWLVAAISLGIAIRLVAPWYWALGPDADRYAAMGHALQRTGSFLMPWGDVYSPGTGLQFSHHYPPLYPLLLAGFYEVLGFSRDTTRIASIVTSLAALAVTYACTRNLYGARKALLATAVVALSPVLILTTDKGYSENLLVALFVGAMWGILRSLKDPWFIVLGALFAALGYLAKSSMGYFFIIAGLGGLAWRLRWRGWKILRDPAYLTGIALFGGTVVAWAARNYYHFGSWQSSTHLAAAYDNAIAHLDQWALLLVFSFLFLFGLGYLLFLAVAPWLPTLARIPRLADEHDSGLWLAILLPLPLTVAIDSALWLYERDFFLHNVRYVTFVLVPLVWLLMRNVRLSKATWSAILVSALILVAGSLYYAIPSEKTENQVSRMLGPLVHDGDSLTFVDTNDVYRYYFDVTHQGTQLNHTVRYVVGPAAANVDTTWAVVLGDGHLLPATYNKTFEVRTGTDALAAVFTVWHL